MNSQMSIKERMMELAERSFQNNQYTFSAFLSMAELSDYYSVERELSYATPKVWGGAEECERCMIRFGNPDSFGYVEEFPISILEILPLQDKFADELSHRDFLGALMNLGIERSTLGDIFVKNKRAYLFCKNTMADFIVENLSKVKHTSIMVKKLDSVDELPKPELKEEMIQLSSLRIDAVIAKAYRLSRNASNELFQSGLVYLNGRICTENAKTVKDGDVISTRGYGKLIFSNCVNVSKKGKNNCKIQMYI